MYLREPGQTHPRFTSVGENIWTGSLSIFSVKGAITSWYNEVKDYSYTANSCRRVCGHYTQVGMELLHLNQEPALPLGHRNSRLLSKIQQTKCSSDFLCLYAWNVLTSPLCKGKESFFFFFTSPSCILFPGTSSSLKSGSGSGSGLQCGVGWGPPSVRQPLCGTTSCAKGWWNASTSGWDTWGTSATAECCQHVRRWLQLLQASLFPTFFFLTSIPKEKGQREEREGHCHATLQLLTLVIREQGCSQTGL